MSEYVRIEQLKKGKSFEFGVWALLQEAKGVITTEQREAWMGVFDSLLEIIVDREATKIRCNEEKYRAVNLLAAETIYNRMEKKIVNRLKASDPQFSRLYEEVRKRKLEELKKKKQKEESDRITELLDAFDEQVRMPVGFNSGLTQSEKQVLVKYQEAKQLLKTQGTDFISPLEFAGLLRECVPSDWQLRNFNQVTRDFVSRLKKLIVNLEEGFQNE